MRISMFVALTLPLVIFGSLAIGLPSPGLPVEANTTSTVSGFRALEMMVTFLPILVTVIIGVSVVSAIRSISSIDDDPEEEDLKRTIDKIAIKEYQKYGNKIPRGETAQETYKERMKRNYR